LTIERIEREITLNKVPEIVPISEMRTHQAAILEQLKQGPIVLTHHSKAAAVLVDPNYWNWLLEQLEDARDLATIRQQEREEADGEVELVPVDEDELKAWASGNVHP
jgi:PHD/YefM family antitoxin component YafN of YafNO toxin-antitoxin module